jgi:hypothetical protein
MPSSIDDRCTPSYETIFMLAKSERYYADMDAVRSKDSGKPSGKRFRSTRAPIVRRPWADRSMATGWRRKPSQRLDDLDQAV